MKSSARLQTIRETFDYAQRFLSVARGIAESVERTTKSESTPEVLHMNQAAIASLVSLSRLFAGHGASLLSDLGDLDDAGKGVENPDSQFLDKDTRSCFPHESGEHGFPVACSDLDVTKMLPGVASFRHLDPPVI